VRLVFRGALLGVGVGRAAFFFGGVPVPPRAAVPVRAAVFRFGAAPVVFFEPARVVAAFLDAGFAVVFAARLVALAAGCARRVFLRPALVAVRRAVFAELDALFRPPVRLPARELVRVAFLVPPAALRLAITCSFSAPELAVAYLDSSR